MKKDRNKKNNKKIYAGVAVVVVLAIAVTAWALSTSKDYRPKHCENDKCLDRAVFKELPQFPEDFARVANSVYYGRFGINEDFSELYPDEYYYKQPEFYGYPENIFDTQGLWYYFYLDGMKESAEKMSEAERQNLTIYLPAFGWGAYPGSLVLNPLKAGQTARTITFVRNGWAMPTVQEFMLVPEFPEETVGCPTAGFNSITNPENINDYFEVAITPEIFLLTPTYPTFTYGWAERAVVEVTARENTPPGKYAVAISPTSVPEEIHYQNYRKYYGKLVDGAKRGGYPYIVCINVV